MAEKVIYLSFGRGTARGEKTVKADAGRDKKVIKFQEEVKRLAIEAERRSQYERPRTLAIQVTRPTDAAYSKSYTTTAVSHVTSYAPSPSGSISDRELSGTSTAATSFSSSSEFKQVPCAHEMHQEYASECDTCGHVNIADLTEVVRMRSKSPQPKPAPLEIKNPSPRVVTYHTEPAFSTKPTELVGFGRYAYHPEASLTYLKARIEADHHGADARVLYRRGQPHPLVKDFNHRRESLIDAGVDEHELPSPLSPAMTWNVQQRLERKLATRPSATVTDTGCVVAKGFVIGKVLSAPNLLREKALAEKQEFEREEKQKIELTKKQMIEFAEKETIEFAGKVALSEAMARAKKTARAEKIELSGKIELAENIELAESMELAENVELAEKTESAEMKETASVGRQKMVRRASTPIMINATEHINHAVCPKQKRPSIDIAAVNKSFDEEYRTVTIVAPEEAEHAIASEDDDVYPATPVSVHVFQDDPSEPPKPVRALRPSKLESPPDKSALKQGNVVATKKKVHTVARRKSSRKVSMRRTHVVVTA